MGKSWPRVDVLLHTPRIGVRKTFDFGGVQRHHRASFVEPDVFVELLRQIGPGNNGSRTRFRIRSIKGLRSAPQSMGTIPLRRRGSGPAFPLPEKPAAAPGAHARASPSFAVAHPSANAETPPRFGNIGRPWWRSKCRHHRAPGDER
jgi:hypothetical protein